MDRLVFGTDGWRDIIGDRFTFDNVARVAQAYAEYLQAQGATRVVVGFDTRFNGELYARRVAEVMAANGLHTLLSSAYLPTPRALVARSNIMGRAAASCSRPRTILLLTTASSSKAPTAAPPPRTSTKR